MTASLSWAVRAELEKLFARKRTYIPLAVALVAEVIFFSLVSHRLVYNALAGHALNFGYDFAEFGGALTMATLFLRAYVSVLSALCIALVAGDIMAREIEDGSIRMVLSRPVSRGTVAGAKLVVSLLYAAVIMLFFAASSWALARLFFGPTRGVLIFDWYAWEFYAMGSTEGWMKFVLGAALLCMQGFVIAAVCFMFSCLRMKSATAIVAPVLLLLLDYVLKNIPFLRAYRHFFLEYHFLCWSRVSQYHVPWPETGQSLAILGAWAVTCGLIGICAFTVRDIKNS